MIQRDGYADRDSSFRHNALGFGKDAIKRKGRPLATMAHLNSSIVEVRAEENCLEQALLIAIARLNKDPNYTSYKKCFKKPPVVRQVLETRSIDLKKAVGPPN